MRNFLGHHLHGSAQHQPWLAFHQTPQPVQATLFPDRKEIVEHARAEPIPRAGWSAGALAWLEAAKVGQLFRSLIVVHGDLTS
jgi:hypothetical protein